MYCHRSSNSQKFDQIESDMEHDGSTKTFHRIIYLGKSENR